MTHRAFVSALAALAVAACGGDGKITEPNPPLKMTPLAAIGTDPLSGATIETDKDDYAPGEVVHLTGRGWAPNETVHLRMTEDPDTHGDVSQDVQADSAGAFSLHFYDVQPHDLGVTFTLTATGQTSGSAATAVFTDGTLSINANTLPNTAGSRVFSPNSDGSLDAATLAAGIAGGGAETNVLIDIRVGTLITGASVRTLGPGVDYNPPPNGTSFNRIWDGKNNAAADVADGIYTARIYSNQQPLGASEVTGARRVQLMLDRTAPVLSALQLAPSSTTPGTTVTFTATATDALTPIVAAEYRIDAGSWLPMAPTAPPFNALSEGLTVSFTAPSPGTYSVCVRARDFGLTWSDGTSCATLVVANPNQSPTANAGGPYEGNEGSDIDLTGSGSDPDGGTPAFAWTVDAPVGVCTFGAPASAVTTVNCKDNGNWTLTLTVTDDEETVATSTASLKVDNVAPTINTKTAGGNANEGATIAFSVSNVTDPSSIDAAAGFTYAFACDGATFGPFGSSPSTTCDAGDGPGSVTIAAKAKDKNGGESAVVSSTFAIVNLAPTITAATNNSPVGEGSNATMTVTGVSDAWPADVATPTYAFACNGVTFGSYGSSNSVSCPTTDGPATITIAAKVKDDDGAESAPFTQTITVNNVPPTITSLNAPSSVPEGTSIDFSVATITDPSPVDEASAFTYAFSCGAAVPTSFGVANGASCPTADDGTVTINARVRDKDGGESATFSKVVTVTNVAPSITLPLNVPQNPIPAGTPVSVAWGFSDPGADTWTCKISWDLPTPPNPLVFDSPFSSSGQTCTATTTLPAGIYTVTVHVADDDAGTDQETATAYIVVYDPSAGFVTGGGWINSPPGAYYSNPSLTGKANFGFVSKYKKGMTVPDGNTEFQFHAGNLNFKSSSYQWLVVTTFKGVFKGTGTINGSGEYGFLLSAIDGQINGGGGVDKFRIKIWQLNANGTEGATIYDNQFGADADANPTTALGGGSIVIHSK